MGEGAAGHGAGVRWIDDDDDVVAQCSCGVGCMVWLTNNLHDGFRGGVRSRCLRRPLFRGWPFDMV